MAISGFAPVEAKTGRELELAMQRLWLGGQELPAGARLVVEHVFQSAAPQTVDAFTASEDSNVGTPQVLCSRDR